MKSPCRQDVKTTRNNKKIRPIFKSTSIIVLVIDFNLKFFMKSRCKTVSLVTWRQQYNNTIIHTTNDRKKKHPFYIIL